MICWVQYHSSKHRCRYALLPRVRKLVSPRYCLESGPSNASWMVHFSWLCCIGHYPINIHIFTPSPVITWHLKWIIEHGDWVGFSCLLTFEDWQFPSFDSRVEYSMNSGLPPNLYHPLIVPQASLYTCPDMLWQYPWKKDKFHTHLTEENLILLKFLHVISQCVICEAKCMSLVRPLCLVFLCTWVQISSGRNYNTF